jgi:tyrosyl-tRNA synthetase
MTENKFNPVEEQLAYLSKGAAEIIPVDSSFRSPLLRPQDSLRNKLQRSFEVKKPLRVKLGVDPTAPDIHLGHAVVIRKLKHFQDMGHTAIFLIGDFTASVGDPTGQSKTRPSLKPAKIKANAKTYLEQVFKILDPEKTEVRYNSEWLGKLTGRRLIKLCSHYSLARMLEREDFRSRLLLEQKNIWKSELLRPETHGETVSDINEFGISSSEVTQSRGPQTISVHELLYPLLQAYDSVKLEADVELGATEQKFNLLVGREIQRAYGQESQVVLTMPILVGLDGQQKMSKSLRNYVGITDAPNEMFGKLMSIPDRLIWDYMILLTDHAKDEVERIKQQTELGNQHPMDIKMRLAEEIVASFHGETAGRRAAEHFQHVFRDRQAPQEMKEIHLKRVPGGVFVIFPKVRDVEERITLPLPSGIEKWSRLLASIKEVASASELERLIKQRGFEINGETVPDPTSKLDLDRPNSYEIRVGKKKFLRIIVE